MQGLEKQDMKQTNWEAQLASWRKPIRVHQD